MSTRRVLFVVAALIAGNALAQSPPAPDAAPAVPVAERAARRFPQPVRVGDLLDRRLLEPKEAQPVLGRVADVVRQRDGGTRFVVRIGGWFGLGARSVAVPADAVALLGEHVALTDLTPEQLHMLPSLDPASVSSLPRDERIRVGVVRPFH